MMALFVCAIYAEFMQPGVITQAHSSLMAQNERTYKSAPTNFFGQTLITLFRIGTLALGICACLCTAEHGSFTVFAAVCGLTIAVLIGKMICNGIVDYTFQISRRFMPAYEQYSDISTLACCLLFPGLMVVLRLGNPTIGYWVLGTVTALFVLMWTYRVVRNYLRNPMAILYIVLYIATLEVLPLGILFYLSSIMIPLI